MRHRRCDGFIKDSKYLGQPVTVLRFHEAGAQRRYGLRVRRQCGPPGPYETLWHPEERQVQFSARGGIEYSLGPFTGLPPA